MYFMKSSAATRMGLPADPIGPITKHVLGILTAPSRYQTSVSSHGGSRSTYARACTRKKKIRTKPLKYLDSKSQMQRRAARPGRCESPVDLGTPKLPSEQ